MERFETKILVFFSKSEELRVVNISETRRKSNISAETRSWVKQIIKKQINSLFEYIGSFTYSSIQLFNYSCCRHSNNFIQWEEGAGEEEGFVDLHRGENPRSREIGD